MGSKRRESGGEDKYETDKSKPRREIFGQPI